MFVTFSYTNSAKNPTLFPILFPTLHMYCWVLFGDQQNQLLGRTWIFYPHLYRIWNRSRYSFRKGITSGAISGPVWAQYHFQDRYGVSIGSRTSMSLGTVPGLLQVNERFKGSYKLSINSWAGMGLVSL